MAHSPADRLPAPEEPLAANPPHRYTLLGPVRALHGAEDRTPRAPKVRTLLALLLTQRGEQTPVDLIIEELWGEAVPPTAVSALQLYVSQLRRLLAPELPARSREHPLTTRNRSYRLEVEPRSVDAQVFVDRCQQGRRALDSGAPAAASRQLAAALALWRGPALADVDCRTVLGFHAHQLTSARLLALESRIEADLRLDRHHSLLAELTGLVREHPLNETFYRQLILAQLRCERRGEALRTYHRAWRTLQTELGIGPGPRLREVHQRILRGDRD